MPRIVLALVSALLSGCFVVPVARPETRVVVRPGHDTADIPGPARLDASVRDGELRVVASRPRRCIRTSFVDTITTEELGADLVAPSTKDSKALAWFAWVSVITLPVSGLVTAVAIAADDPRSTTLTETHVEGWPCPLAVAALPVRIELPSGTVVDAFTDRNGAVRLRLPAGEPPSGRIVVRASGGRLAAVARYQARPRAARS
jgi:hypothetical protein